MSPSPPAHSPDHLLSLQQKWKTLYRTTLPSLARSKHPAQPKWPVTLDHCFARIILDNTIGCDSSDSSSSGSGEVRKWDTVLLKKPAYKHMSVKQLQAAIELGERVARGEVDLVVLDGRSLAARGKGREVGVGVQEDVKQEGKGKADGSKTSAFKSEEGQFLSKRKRKHDGAEAGDDGPKKTAKQTKLKQATLLSFLPSSSHSSSSSKKPIGTGTSTSTSPSTTKTKTSAPRPPQPTGLPTHPPPPTTPSLTSTTHAHPLLPLHTLIHTHPHLSPFRRHLYSTLLTIPRGRWTTYAALASYLGSHPRAIGSGIRNNPFAPDVPCHRVLASGGGVGGFGCGGWGDQGRYAGEKVGLLRGEGVRFDEKGKKGEMVAKGVAWMGFYDLGRVLKEGGGGGGEEMEDLDRLERRSVAGKVGEG